MAKFHDAVGYAESYEVRPGVWVDQMIEISYFGDVLRNTRRLSDGTGLNNDLSVGNTISILADPYALEHFFAIRYVKWAGAPWTVTEVEVKRPRLLLKLGGVYNGPTSGTPVSP